MWPRGSDEHFVKGGAFARQAETGAGGGVRFARAVREPCPAGLTAPARMHLRLYGNLPPQALSARASLAGSGGDFARRDGNAVAPQNLARLILVEVHVCSFVLVVPASP